MIFRLKKKKKLNNAGFSLVELIAIIAILSILTVTVTYSVRMVANKSCDQCAVQLKQTVQNNRANTMSKLRGYVLVYYTYDGIVIEECVTNADGTNQVKQKKVGDRSVVVTYTLSNGNVYNLGDYGTEDALYIEFDRSSGSLKKIDGSKMGTAKDGLYISNIDISKGSKAHRISFAFLTGKVTLD